MKTPKVFCKYCKHLMNKFRCGGFEGYSVPYCDLEGSIVPNYGDNTTREIDLVLCAEKNRDGECKQYEMRFRWWHFLFRTGRRAYAAAKAFEKERGE